MMVTMERNQHKKMTRSAINSEVLSLQISQERRQERAKAEEQQMTAATQ